MAEDFLSRVNEWSAWMSAPENRAALIQGGLAMMQPRMPGQTLGGHAAQAMSQGLAAGGNLLNEEEKRRDVNRKFDIQEMRAAKQDARSDLAEERFFWQRQQAENREARQQALDAYRLNKDVKADEEKKAKRGTEYVKGYTAWAKDMVGDSLEPDALNTFMMNPQNKARYDRALEGEFGEPPAPTVPTEGNTRMPGAYRGEPITTPFQKGVDVTGQTVRRATQQMGPIKTRFKSPEEYKAAKAAGKVQPGDTIMIGRDIYKVK